MSRYRLSIWVSLTLREGHARTQRGLRWIYQSQEEDRKYPDPKQSCHPNGCFRVHNLFWSATETASDWISLPLIWPSWAQQEGRKPQTTLSWLLSYSVSTTKHLLLMALFLTAAQNWIIMILSWYLFIFSKCISSWYI